MQGCCLQCAMHCNAPRYETTWSFHGVAPALRRCAGSTTDARFVPLVTCLRATSIERGETRILENGESESERERVSPSTRETRHKRWRKRRN